MSDLNVEFEARKTLRRLLPQVERSLADDPDATAGKTDEAWAIFERNLDAHWPRLFGLLFEIYGHRYDLYYFLEQVLETLAKTWLTRPAPLRQLDLRRQHDPDWHLRPRMVGGALYVDLFSENLGRLREHIAYLQDLGLTYLHLMPLFAVRPGDNDGGYAISNYRSVDPRLGTVEDLRALASDLREHGISLTLDFVFNHTADDHEWAAKAQAGDREYEEYYYMFPDRTMPDQYERSLREIFPTVRRGNFTWHEGMRRWVWTTFNSYQWDLRYANPAVFNAMLGEMLFLANTGVEILRLDAVAFIWKQMGTSCENLPQAHTLIRAFNAAASIAAPGLLFKSEAIVAPRDVIKYVSREECQLSYNPTLMALLWESLATRETKLLVRSVQQHHYLPDGCVWANYLRCHDDIGWSFDDDDARSVGIEPYSHRQFLNAFYTGQHPGSFARGIPFQFNSETGDMRISGTLASLAGLEQAIDVGNDEWREMALRRILLLHSVLFTVGGFPLLYLGEEWGTLNDYDFVRDPAKAGDTRWVHRPKMRWDFLEELKDQKSIRRRLFTAIRAMIATRKELPALYGNEMETVPVDNPHVFSIMRIHEGNRLIVLANFCERPVTVAGNRLRTIGLGRFFLDRLTGTEYGTANDLTLEPYQALWLERC